MLDRRRLRQNVMGGTGVGITDGVVSIDPSVATMLLLHSQRSMLM